MNVRIIGTVVSLAVLLYCTYQEYGGFPIPIPGGPVTPAPEIPDPPESLRPEANLLRQVIENQAEPSERQLLCGFFLAAADTIERDGSVLSSTGEVRSWLVYADRLLLQKRGVSVVGFGDAKDRILTSHVGLEDQPLTDEVRRKLVEALRAVAWACR